MNGTIYCIRNTKNSKLYIGATKKKITARFNQHKRDGKTQCKNGCRLLQQAFKELGEECFSIETLLVCNIEHLESYEQKFIELYGTLTPNGYNLKSGGNLGSKHSEESKKLIGLGNKNKIVSDDARQNIGASSKYRNMSEENKTKIQNALSELNLTDLPMYIVYSIDRRYNRNVDVISVRVPNKKYRQFSLKSDSLAKKIELAINYKQSLLT